MSEERAEQREMTGLSRVDRDNYFVGAYEVGSEMDLKFNQDLK